jgi:hypothetical protein
LQQIAIYGVQDVQVLADGRASAVVGLHIPPDDVAYLAVFVRRGERWLIDETTVVTLDASAAPIVP